MMKREAKLERWESVMSIIQFKPRKANTEPASYPSEDEALFQLVRMANQTCLLCLDRAIKYSLAPDSFALSAVRANAIAERMVRACGEVKSVLYPSESIYY